MSKRAEIVSFLDRVLEVKTVPDPYCPNGLQVEGAEDVKKIGVAVDACLQTFQALQDCQMIITHHGLFWPAVKSIKGPIRRALGYLFERNINLYSVHLPLDVHPEYGNNVQLLRKLGWQAEERFDQVGWIGEGKTTDRDSLCQDLEKLLGSKVRLLPFGDSKISKIAMSSGGGSIGLLASAQAAGADIVVTGEASHPIYHAAKEMGINLILAGHYKTETWGVQALRPLLEREFGVESTFVDFPTEF